MHSKGIQDDYSPVYSYTAHIRRQRKLRFSDSSIEEIASECGIADASYFNKVFRRIEGMTASQYRSMWKGGIKTRNLPQQD